MRQPSAHVFPTETATGIVPLRPGKFVFHANIIEDNEAPLPWTGAPCSPERTPGFPVRFPGVAELHAAFLDESRTRIRWSRLVQEIRDHGPKKTGGSPFQRF
jgi:hypothetical protein